MPVPLGAPSAARGRQSLQFSKNGIISDRSSAAAQVAPAIFPAGKVGGVGVEPTNHP